MTKINEFFKKSSVRNC